ncbi:MAG: hypothetical protein WB870_11695 [Gallionellaceae bacterium]
MANNLEKLEKKRARLEAVILQAKQAEKRKARVLQLVVTALEKHPRALEADEGMFRAKLEFLFEELAQNFPHAEK